MKEKNVRRLAANMFTDIVGFTRRSKQGKVRKPKLTTQASTTSWNGIGDCTLHVVILQH